MGQIWMQNTLGQICRNVSLTTIENLSGVHLKEAVLMVKEAVQYYDTPLFQVIPSDRWSTECTVVRSVSAC